MNEIKMDFINQKLNDIKIGNKLEERKVKSPDPKKQMTYSEIQCITIDA